MATNPELPQDILLEIFSRIPAKSVGKCRTLSKSWNTHLSTNSFIKKHLITHKQTIQQQNLAFSMKYIEQMNKVHIFTSPTKDDEVWNDISFQEEVDCFIGSCNGLILQEGIDENFLLVNPITLKQVKVPIQKQGYIGFGYDSCSNDYKIVNICCYTSENSTRVVDVYSVKTGVWKTLDDCCYPYGECFPTRYSCEGGVFVNGAVHWLIRGNGEYCSCIAAFDLASEVFREISLPEGFVRQDDDLFHRYNGVSVLDGCLTVVDNYEAGWTNVWIMKEYGVAESWEGFCIDPVDNQWDFIEALLCYVRDGELLFLTSWNHLFAYDLKEETARKVVLGGFDDAFGHGIGFVDSLVSPEGSW